MKMSRKIIILCLISLLILVSMATSVLAETIHITIGTASIGGAFYPIGMGLAKLWNDEVPGVKAVAQATAGSPQNIELLRTGELQVSVVRGQACYEAYFSLGRYEGQEAKATYLRALIPLYYSGTQITVLKNSGIESVADFRGKKIAVGPIGSGGDADSRRLLKLFGMTYDDIKPEFVEASQAVEMMKDGLIQGAILGLTIGAASITELMVTGRVNLISIEEDKLEGYFKDHSTAQKYVIDEGTYPNQDYDVITYCHLPVILGTTEDMDEETAYNLVKAMYENPDRVKESHSILAKWKSELAAMDIKIPYHPGAEKFWKEVGIKK
ncbi:hypothetical protein ES708_19879 [subsurface metagenome]